LVFFPISFFCLIDSLYLVLLFDCISQLDLLIDCFFLPIWFLLIGWFSLCWFLLFNGFSLGWLLLSLPQLILLFSLLVWIELVLFDLVQFGLVQFGFT
jgi:hypothetical protein